MDENTQDAATSKIVCYWVPQNVIGIQSVATLNTWFRTSCVIGFQKKLSKRTDGSQVYQMPNSKRMLSSQTIVNRKGHPIFLSKDLEIAALRPEPLIDDIRDATMSIDT